MRIDGLRYAALAWLAVSGLAAAEHHGQVSFNGLPVPGATVTATGGDKRFVAVTDQQGAYSFPDLADGVWTIQVEMLCFATIKQEVAVAPDAPSPVWELKVLPLEEIHAAATQPAAAQPPAAAAAASRQARQESAAQGAAAANPQAGFQRADVNAAGEGAAPGGLGAEMGNESGAAGDLNQTASDAMVVSGSSSGAIERRAIGNARRGPGSMYQGDLSLILDNSALDARPYSLTGQNTEKPAYDHLRAGASFGGPLLIPHLLRGQGQFFVNYQTTRNRNDSTDTSLMPDQAMRNGDFSASAISDPSNGQPFPGNAIPASRIAPQSTALLKFYPLPNFPESAGYNYQVPLVGISHQDDVQGRANKTLNRKHFVNGSFAYRNARSSGPNVFGFDDTGNTTGMNANATWRYMASQRLNFSLGYQFSRLTMRTTPYFANRENVSGEAGITGNNQDPGNWGPPNLSFASGIAGISDAALSLTRNQTSGVSFTGFWMRRPHNITFGADFRRQQFNLLAQQNARGSFTFTGAASGQRFRRFPAGRSGHQLDRLRQRGQVFPGGVLRRVLHRRLAGEPGPHHQCRRALGIQLAHHGELWPAGEPGRSAGICGRGAGGGQQPHGSADRAAISRFAGSARQARIAAARGALVAPVLRHPRWFGRDTASTTTPRSTRRLPRRWRSNPRFRRA